MANFSANNALGGTPQAMTTTYKTLVSMSAATATLRRGKVYDLLIGTLGTPADNVTQWDASRITAIGTGTNVVPPPLDPADSASGTVVTTNNTAEPTYTATTSLFNVGINQRASYRWVAAPGSELVWPATNLNGIGLRCLSPSYTGTASGQALYQDQ